MVKSRWECFIELPCSFLYHRDDHINHTVHSSRLSPRWMNDSHRGTRGSAQVTMAKRSERIHFQTYTADCVWLSICRIDSTWELFSYKSQYVVSLEDLIKALKEVIDRRPFLWVSHIKLTPRLKREKAQKLLYRFYILYIINSLTNCHRLSCSRKF